MLERASLDERVHRGVFHHRVAHFQHLRDRVSHSSRAGASDASMVTSPGCGLPASRTAGAETRRPGRRRLGNRAALPAPRTGQQQDACQPHES